MSRPMPKYAEGAVSPSGKYVVRGGEWVPNDAAGKQDFANVEADRSTGAVARRSPYGDIDKLVAGDEEELRRVSDAGGHSIDMAAGLASGGPIAAGAIRAIPGVAGRVLRFASKPAVATGLATAAPDLARGDIGGAITQGTIGALAGRVLGGKGSAQAATIGGMVSAAGKATIQREFAKTVTKGLPRGAKIHLKLDADGLPLDVITSDQAAKLPEHLKSYLRKTW